MASAASPAPQVAFSDCDSEPLGKPAFLRALALELGRGQLHETSPESAGIVVSYRCDGIAHVQIRGTQSKVLRDLRTDDVAPKDRVRALALAVAELARAGDESPEKVDTAPEAPTEAAEHPAVAETPPEPAKRAESKKQTPKAPPSPAPASKEETKGEVNSSTSSRAARVSASFALRFNLGVDEFYYGAALGADLHGFRLQLEGVSAHATTDRGSITSGVVALRFGRALPPVRLGVVETGLLASVAAGANWAVGSSSVPDTLVRRVLMPYVDARLGLWATSSEHIPFTPLCEVYVGRGVGIVALSDGEKTLSTGGWFTGFDIGLWL